MRLRINVCICNPTWISTSLFRACHGLLAESCPGASCKDRTFDGNGWNWMELVEAHDGCRFDFCKLFFLRNDAMIMTFCCQSLFVHARASLHLVSWGEDIQKQAILLAEDAGKDGKREFFFGHLAGLTNSNLPVPLLSNFALDLRRRSLGLWARWKLGWALAAGIALWGSAAMSCYM